MKFPDITTQHTNQAILENKSQCPTFVVLVFPASVTIDVLQNTTPIFWDFCSDQSSQFFILKSPWLDVFLSQKARFSSGSARVPIFLQTFLFVSQISEHGIHRVPLFRNLTGTLMEHALSCPTLLNWDKHRSRLALSRSATQNRCFNPSIGISIVHAILDRVFGSQIPSFNPSIGISIVHAPPAGVHARPV